MALDLAKHDELASSKSFTYQPLDPNMDCIRLLHIQPATDDDEPIICTLEHVEFKGRPKFEALSYMWGDESVTFEIHIDGAKFEVGRNLRDGLRLLRTRAATMPVWIDAICINQRDLSERSRQVRIMHHIYYRAQSVIVWLGQKYLKHQKDPTTTFLLTEQELSTPDLGVPAEQIEPDDPGKYLPLHQERDMVRELCVDGYWDRVWIIQEIGKARRIQVCFGQMTLAWNEFIEMINLHEDCANGALRLHRQLQEKYNAGHTLRKLLQDHRHALCQEPRDKIYALVGLAQDASGFPVDYGKSLLDIWTDTMEFMNRHGRLPTADVIAVASLVKDMLIGADRGPLEQVLHPYDVASNSPEGGDEPYGPGVYQLETYILGCVRDIGPTTDDIVGTLSEADRWAGMIQRNFQDELGETHKENDLLLKTILEADEANPIACYDCVSGVQWSIDGDNKRLQYFYAADVQRQQERAADLSRRDDNSCVSQGETTAGSQYLFQFSQQPMDSDPFDEWGFAPSKSRSKVPWKLGIASSQTKPGDLVCWTKGATKAMVVRFGQISDKWEGQVVGTAVFADGLSIFDPIGYPKKKSGSSSLEENLIVKVDSDTLYVLIA
ncbi:hypothetical protein GQ53DRAFT_710804 [Thozetella sp. PMI_491]|nr:hypothetical protein GQ53DRAFT_710804 [Thozetella sp. PMI_491]